MRVWKNKKGVTAYLVFMISSLILGSTSLQAKEPKRPIEALALDRVSSGKEEMPAMPGEADNTFPPMPPGGDFGKGMPPRPPESFRSRGSDAPIPPGPPPGMDRQFFPPDGNNPFPPGMPEWPDQMDPGDTGGGGRPPMPPGFRRNPGRPPMNNAPMGKEAPMPSSNDQGMPPAAQRGARNNTKQQNANESDITHVVPQKCVPAKGQFNWNLEDEKLSNIIRQMSLLKCRTVVLDGLSENLKMTIVGPAPLTPDEAWDVLAASLAAKGFTLIEQNKTWYVIKRGDSKSFPTPIYAKGNQARNNEEIGTFFYKVRHASQDVLKNVASRLISKDGLVDSVGDQFVIVIDSNSNIRRLGYIFSQVDIEDASGKIHMVPLTHADAKTVEKQLRDLFDISSGPQRSRKRRPNGPQETRSVLNIDKIIADERTNNLIVIADKDSVEKLKEVIAMIDLPPSDQGSKGKIHVKKLRYADAKTIAETLEKVVQQGKGNRFGRRRDEGTNELFEGEVKITANASTNTLVTVASANDYRSLLETIEKLDENRHQIYIEAAILDIEVKDKSDLGINLFAGLANVGGVEGSLGIMANPGGRTIASDIKSSVTSSALGTSLSELGTNGLGALAVLSNFLSGGVAGIVGPAIGPGNKIPSFGAVLQALSETANVDVLSTPYLLTTDNQQAEMSVGDKIPVLRGASNLGGGLGGGLGNIPYQSVQHEDVKLTFKVTPHLGADDNVRLDIEQEVNELGTKMTILNQDQWSIRTKSAKTQLVLKDQQTGVIGGLMHHSSSQTEHKVPFLGDIPIINLLFKTYSTTKNRRSLLLILTVYIIKTEEDYRKVLERKLKEREEFARLYYGGKIKNYNPYIDYDKKPGPLSSLLLSVDQEMNKTENGGPGDGSEVIIKPKEGEPSKSNESVPNVNMDGMSTDETAFLKDVPSFEGDAAFDFREVLPNEGVLDGSSIEQGAP